MLTGIARRDDAVGLPSVVQSRQKYPCQVYPLHQSERGCWRTLCHGGDDHVIDRFHVTFLALSPTPSPIRTLTPHIFAIPTPSFSGQQITTTKIGKSRAINGVTHFKRIATLISERPINCGGVLFSLYSLFELLGVWTRTIAAVHEQDQERFGGPPTLPNTKRAPAKRRDART